MKFRRQKSPPAPLPENVMNSNTSRLLIALVSLLASPAVTAGLKVGDPAPKIQVGKWIQGEPVTEIAGDKVYLVEFWATWCGPCVAAIPHLNDFHRKYQDRGLVVIGQNLGEQDVAGITAFVKKMGSKMTYRVALDDVTGGDKGRMARTWLTAAGQTGIPCGFVVNKRGKIAYIGHPMALEESLLETLLAEPSTKPADTAALAPGVAAKPNPKAAELAARAAAEIAAGKLDEAEATIAELNSALAGNLLHVAGLLEIDLLLARKQPDDAAQLAKLIAEDYAKQPEVVNAAAARLVDRADATDALQQAAEGIAGPSAKVEGPGQAAALATLARIAMMRGQQDRAVELQTKAAGLSNTSDAKAALEAYQQGRLPGAPAR